MSDTVYTCCEPDCGLPSRDGLKAGLCQHHTDLLLAPIKAKIAEYQSMMTGGPVLSIDDIVSVQPMTARPVGPDGKPLWEVVFVSKWRWRWMTFKSRVTWWLWRRWSRKGRAQRARQRVRNR